jgi:hypothetical protein
MRWQPFLVGPRMQTIVTRLCRADSDHALMLGLDKFSDPEAESSSSDRAMYQRPICGCRGCLFFCVSLEAGLAARVLAVLVIRRSAVLGRGPLLWRRRQFTRPRAGPQRRLPSGLHESAAVISRWDVSLAAFSV